VKLVGLYYTVNTSTYIIHHVGRTILRCGNTTSASYFSLKIYVTYIMVIFCRVQHSNTTPLAGCPLVVGLMTITDKQCKMWCGDIIHSRARARARTITHTQTQIMRVTKINPTLWQGKAFSILDVTTYQWIREIKKSNESNTMYGTHIIKRATGFG
jgi:hypothetical protein